MIDKTKTDFLIVGSGLAGCVLALQLLAKGKSVVVIGKEENISSRIAAGLFNPITGKVLSKTWMADEIFAHLHEFYTKAEKIINQSFFHLRPIYRPFLSIEEQNEWMGKSAEPTWQAFIEKVFTASAGWKGVSDPYGGLLLRKTGYVNTSSFLDATRKYLQHQHSHFTEAFDYTQLTTGPHGVAYKSRIADKIIFCEGVDVLHNPYFYWVPMRPLKGETIRVEADLPTEVIINRGVYAVPQENGTFKIGATYEPKDLTPQVTTRGRTELEEKLHELFILPHKTVAQEWGLRPTMPDRRPVIGKHPNLENVFIFNGLGTKGVSLAPFIGEMLCEFLVHGTTVPTYAFVDVNRYNSLYWKAVKTHED